MFGIGSSIANESQWERKNKVKIFQDIKNIPVGRFITKIGKKPLLEKKGRIVSDHALA